MSNKSALKRFLADESGASLAEYALLLGVVVIAVLAAAKVFGTNMSDMFTKMNSNLNNAS